jgi:hypothetical protein
MLKPVTAAIVLSLLMAAPALADGKVYVQLPDLSGYAEGEAEALLSEVVTANVISSNCPGFEVTEAEWSLLTDSADILARGRLGLSVDAYDTDYYGPAFALLDEAGACAEYGPRVQPILDQLVELGGSREARPDQDAAYQEEQARQAAWDAGETGDAPKKTKSK